MKAFDQDGINKFQTHIFERIIGEVFNQPLKENRYRSDYVERLIVEILGDEFELTSSDWAAWDITHNSGLKIEVKQSAARQSWSGDGTIPDKPNVGRFDIAERSYVWDKKGWRDQLGRVAGLYIFAWHPIYDPDIADHRDPRQWTFYVLPSQALPAGQKSIGLRPLQQLAEPVTYAELQAAANEAAKQNIDTQI